MGTDRLVLDEVRIEVQEGIRLFILMYTRERVVVGRQGDQRGDWAGQQPICSSELTVEDFSRETAQAVNGSHVLLAGLSYCPPRIRKATSSGSECMVG